MGNFVVCGGNSAHGGVYANGWNSQYIYSSHIRDPDGSLSDSARYSEFAPLRACDGPASTFYEITIRPWYMYTGSQASSGASLTGKSQYATVPGMYSYCDVGRYKNQVDCDAFNPGVEAWKEIVDIAGGQYIYGTFGFSNHVFISMSESDW